MVPALATWTATEQRVVGRHREDEWMMTGTVTAAVSTRKQEKNVVITHLVVVELRTERARRHVCLCDHEHSLQSGKERTDTSRRSPSPNSLCVSDSGRLDSLGTSWCTYASQKKLVLVTERRTFTGSEPGGLSAWLPKVSSSSSGRCSSRVDV